MQRYGKNKVNGQACADQTSEATSLTGLVPEWVLLTVHTTEPTGTVPEPFHCDHIARWSARTGTSGRSGTDVNTGNWNGSGTVPVSNLWCEHGLISPMSDVAHDLRLSLQPPTLSSWSHWPRGPVDLKSYCPPPKSTGPQYCSNDVSLSKPSST